MANAPQTDQVRVGAPVMIYGPDGEQAELKKTGHDYSLSCPDRVRFGTTRVRWGNKEEISEDIRHFETYGCLPTPHYPSRW